MRKIIPAAVAIASLAIAAVALAASQAPTGSSGQRPVAQGIMMTAPATSTRPPDAASKSLVAMLTASQCTSAGGDVVSGDEIATLCKSGSYCITVDANKVAHRVCLSAQ